MYNYGFPSFSLLKQTVPKATTCYFSVSSAIFKVFYNGEDITDLVEGPLTTPGRQKRIDFVLQPGAPLVVVGYDFNSGGCDSAGFTISCTKNASSANSIKEWQVLPSDGEITDAFAVGSEMNWSTPCRSSAPYLSLHADRAAIKMWSGKKWGAFRWITPGEQKKSPLPKELVVLLVHSYQRQVFLFWSQY